MSPRVVSPKISCTSGYTEVGQNWNANGKSQIQGQLQGIWGIGRPNMFWWMDFFNQFSHVKDYFVIVGVRQILWIKEEKMNRFRRKANTLQTQLNALTVLTLFALTLLVSLQQMFP